MSTAFQSPKLRDYPTLVRPFSQPEAIRHALQHLLCASGSEVRFRQEGEERRPKRLVSEPVAGSNAAVNRLNCFADPTGGRQRWSSKAGAPRRPLWHAMLMADGDEFFCCIFKRREITPVVGGKNPGVKTGISIGVVLV